jgi:predicted negative regulator of RcsB-dependent stress response
MDIYASDEEKGEAIKQWWRNNGMSVAMGIALGFAAVGGIKYWQGQQQGMKIEASKAYQVVIAAAEADDIVVAQEQTEQLMAEFPESSYATLAAFKIAEQKVVAKDIAAAKTYLQWIVNNASLSGQADIARLRLARLLASESAFDEALALTAQATNDAFSSLYSEVRGDIYYAQAKLAEAHAAYQTALDTADTGRQATLQLKLDNVAVADEG